ncbi:STAS domain-containing protein [Sporomusa sp. KB1]|jgi:anti-anti-sigma factor|uniref:STAS domain-containing protein n=1 Tax=Sporomusa sp. KB1 TaxID=943346 RepID=UPI00119EB767|nr:STAS domain-containing protein [Sporomusa sp. KB1]TWH45572.1 anti-sigma B factor antagonist [Sporomusa sp. KB1]
MDIRSAGDVKIPVIIPRVDAHTAKEVEAKLNDLVNGGSKRIVCDFSQNDYISSAGLRVFLQMLKIMQKSGGKIVLCSLKPQVKEVFDMAGFSQLFRIFDTEEDAVKEL